MQRLSNIILYVFVLMCSVFSAVQISVAQEVVVNEYVYRTPAKQAEWVELLVVGDNINLSGWSLRDNNDNLTSWTAPFVFSASPVWQNLRRGTVILLKLQHQPGDPFDTDKSDGAIEISLPRNAGDPTANLFTAPVALPSMEINGLGDIVQLRQPDGTHVHALAHRNIWPPIPGLFSQLADYAALPTPKLIELTLGSLSDNTGVRVFPGENIGQYSASAGLFGLLIEGANASAENTRALPNLQGTEIQNVNFWRALRQPDWSSGRTMTATFPTPSSVLLQWQSPFTDVNPSDSVSGYMIARSEESNFFFSADSINIMDGRLYNPNDILGQAQVVAVLRGSQRTSFEVTNNLPPCGDTVYYRVFAWRYNGSSDGLDGNQGWSVAELGRGRSYNESQFAQIAVTRPTPTGITVDIRSSDVQQPTGTILPLCKAPYSYTVNTPANTSTVIYRNGQPFAPSNSASLNQPGTYYAQITDNFSGCFITTALVTIEDTDLEVTISMLSDSIQCLQGNNFVLRMNPSPTGGTFAWRLAGNTIAPVNQQVDISFTSPGTYDIEGTYTYTKSGISCSTTVTQRLVVLPSPVLTFSPLSKEARICLGDSTILFAGVAGSTRFRWIGFPEGQQSITVRPTQTRWYVFQADTAACSIRDSVRVTVIEQPIGEIIPEGGKFELCQGEQLRLRANITRGDSFEWLPSGSRDTVISVATQTAVSLRISTLDGCSFTTSASIRQVQRPQALIKNAGTVALCPEDSVVLEAVGPFQADVRYRWNTGDTTPVIAVRQTGEYFWIAENAAGCRDSSEVITVRTIETDFSLSISSVNFGVLAACESELSFSFAIRNISFVDTLRLEGVVAEPFFLSPRTVVIPPNDTVMINGRFIPTASGTFVEQATFTSQFCNKSLSFPMSGSSNRETVLTTSVNALLFDTLFSCETIPTRNVDIITRTAAGVTIQDIRLNAPFRSVQQNINDSTLRLTVFFEPTAEGDFATDIQILYQQTGCPDTLTLNLPVAGEYRIPEAEFPAGDTIAFPPVIGCDAFSEATIAVANISAYQIPVRFSFSGNASSWQVLNPPSVLQAGNQAQLPLRYTPTAASTDTTILRIEADYLCADGTRPVLDSIVLIGSTKRTSLLTRYQSEILLLAGCQTQSTIPVTIINPSDQPVQIDEVSFGGNFFAEISGGVLLPANDSLVFNVGFRGSVPGQYNGVITLTTKPCDDTITIQVQGVVRRVSLQMTRDSLDFGTVQVGNTVSSDIVVVNDGDVPVTFEQLRGIGSPFVIEAVLKNSSPIPLPINLLPGDTIVIRVRFVPEQNIQAVGLFLLQTSLPCITLTDSIVVQGRGTLQPVEEDFIIALTSDQTFSAYPGERVKLAVRVGIRNSNLQELNELPLRISYNPNHLVAEKFLPVNGAEVALAENSPGEVTLRVQNITLPSTSTAVGSIEFKALLYPLVQSQVVISADTLLLRQNTGLATESLSNATSVFTLLDTCGSSDKQIVAVGGLKFRVVRTGGASVIEVTTDTDDDTKLEIYSVLGKKIFNTEAAITKRGTYSYPLDTTANAQGMYFAVIRRVHEVYTVPIFIE